MEKNIEIKKETKIKDYFIKSFQEDQIGWFIDEMNPVITFEDVYNKASEVYSIINVFESEVREIIFEVISKVYNEHYDEIYYRWLGRK